MSAAQKDSIGDNASDQESSSDEEGFLNLPKPSAPYSRQANDDSESVPVLLDDKAEEKIDSKSTPQLHSMLSEDASSLYMNSNYANTKDSDSDSSEGGSQSADTWLQFFTNEVYNYALSKITTGCSVKFQDTEEEFSKKAGRLDTQQLLKQSTHIYKLLSDDVSKWGLKLNSGYRVHDAMSWSRYESECEILRQLRGANFTLDERYLFCGVRRQATKNFETDVPKRNGYFGQGIYFTDSPLKAFMYACHYVVERPATILVCRVILGESKQYAKGERRTDADQRREPLKEKIDGKLVYYDSVCGRPKDFKEYVVYQSSRVFIEYVLDVSEDFTTFRRRVEKILQLS